MISKTIVFVIVALFTFSSLIIFLPAEFRSTGAFAQAPYVISTLSANDMIIYKNQGADNMTHGYSSLEDAPDAPQWNASLPEGEYLEVWWNQQTIYGIWVIQINHVHQEWFGWGYKDQLTWYYKNGTQCQDVWPFMLTRTNLVAAWDSETNSSVFTAKCAHASVSMFFKPWGYDDIGESYDNEALQYGFSYEWNPDASGFAVLGLLTQVLTFQGVGLDIPGVFGGLVDGILGTFLWVVIAFVVYKIFTGLIPWLSGGSGD